MTCLRKSPANGPGGIVSCGEDGCEYRSIQIAGVKVPVRDQSKADCIQKLEAEVKLIHKIEALIEEYLQERMFEITHDLAIKIANDLLKEK